MEKKIEKELELPTEISTPTLVAPRDLCIVSIPKCGKSMILGHLTTTRNGIVLDLERGGYEYVAARKLSTYESPDTSKWDSFQNYVKYRNLLMDNRGKYEFLIVDGLTDLDDLSEIGGTIAYMNSVQGKKFNRRDEGKGDKIPYGDPDWKSVTTLGEGYGYRHTREWFMHQIDIFKQISPYRIYAAHIADKYIQDNGKEKIIGSEIAITGQLKRIFAAKVTSLAKLVADGEDRYLNFDVVNDSILAGSRAPQLKGKILISKMGKDEKLETYWENIYK